MYIILALITIYAVIISFLFFRLKRQIVTLEDNGDITDSIPTKALKLSKEIFPYIKSENGKHILKVLKNGK